MSNKIQRVQIDVEEAIFEVNVKYAPGMIETKWLIKKIPELITMDFKNELKEDLGIDLGTIEIKEDEIDWVRNK